MNQTPHTAPTISLRRIDRAVHELRGGYPVLLTQGQQASLILSAEYFLDDHAEPLLVFPAGKSRLVLSATRLRRLALAEANAAQSLPFGELIASPADFAALVDPVTATTLETGTKQRLQAELQPANPMETAALELVKLAGLLPAAAVAPMAIAHVPQWLGENHILQVGTEDVLAHQQALVTTLRPVASAPVPLALAENAQVIAFRPRYGAVEHLAVVIGDPQKADAPLVRVHSSCVTGDILGSLRCDCGEQLHEAIRRMAAEGCGVLLYMSQEGRGIGIANKLRAYGLQDAGLDTLDANEEIGFAADERQFDAAAALLRVLRLNRIRLLSNNPLKQDALRQAGIEVVGLEPLKIKANHHNQAYLDTKTSRMGHS